MDTPVGTSTPSIERRPEGLVVTMRVPRSGCSIAFLAVWLLLWLVGESVGVLVVVATSGRFGFPAVFAWVWIALWTFAGATAAASLAVLLNGLEIVTLSPDGLSRRVEAFGIGRTRTYDPTKVEELRAVDSPGGKRASIGFEYEGRTHRWGSGLTPESAKTVVDAMLAYGAPKA